jgi:hypothetical protein
MVPFQTKKAGPIMKRFTLGYGLPLFFAAVFVSSPSFSQTQFKSKEIGEVVLRISNLRVDLADAQSDMSNSFFSRTLGGEKLRVGEEIKCLRDMENSLGPINITLQKYWTAYTIRDMMKHAADKRSATEISDILLKSIRIDLDRAEKEINQTRRQCSESEIVNKMGLDALEVLSAPALKSALSGLPPD